MKAAGGGGGGGARYSRYGTQKNGIGTHDQNISTKWQNQILIGYNNENVINWNNASCSTTDVPTSANGADGKTYSASGYTNGAAGDAGTSYYNPSYINVEKTGYSFTA